MSGTVEDDELHDPSLNPAPAPAEASVRRGVLEDYVAFHLRMSQAYSFRAFKRNAGIPGLRPGWFAVLSLINDNPGITPLSLSRASGRDKSTITPILRDLSRERLIARQEIPSDRRSYSLHLTPKGEQALAHLSVSASAHERELDAIIGDQKEVLLDLLRRIVAELG